MTNSMSPRKPATTCAECFAWGVLSGRFCSACSVFKRNHPGETECRGCGRVMALKDGCCRLCWRQASLEANSVGGLPRGAVTVLESGRRLAQHQLFFDRMKLRRAEPPVRIHDRRGRPRNPPPAPAVRPAILWTQPRLFDTRPDFTRFDERVHADLANPWLLWAHYLAHRRGETRGWTSRVRCRVHRGLVIVLSQHTAGDTVRYSEMSAALRALDIGTERVAEVLEEMGVLVDDRRPSFEDWLARKLEGLVPGISRDVEAWQQALHNGGPRTRARDRATGNKYMNSVRLALTAWSGRYQHLREVTRDDILVVLAPLHGSQRSITLIALRSLFAFCKRNGTVFRNPTGRIKVGEHGYNVIQPLRPIEVGEAIAAATTPASRLLLALAAVHAARSGAIRALRLDDTDIGNRRLVIAGRIRPLDELTHQILLDWLDYRRTRWPNTANLHLIVNQQTALESGPVSGVWVTKSTPGTGGDTRAATRRPSTRRGPRPGQIGAATGAHQEAVPNTTVDDRPLRQMLALRAGLLSLTARRGAPRRAAPPDSVSLPPAPSSGRATAGSTRLLRCVPTWTPNRRPDFSTLQQGSAVRRSRIARCRSRSAAGHSRLPDARQPHPHRP